MDSGLLYRATVASRPTRARGLKLAVDIVNSRFGGSRPTRARGLKRQSRQVCADQVLSRPTRARGLKQPPLPPPMSSARVAPHAGAWIETYDGLKLIFDYLVAPHAGAWIETSKLSRSGLTVT